MTPAQVHLALNHVPVLLVPVGLLLLAVAVWRRSIDLKRAGLALIVAASLISIPVFYSGEGAEEIVEHRAGVKHDDIHEHEEAAERGFVLILVTGALAAITLFLSGVSERFRWAPWVVLLVGLLTSVTIFRVAHLGGLVRHPELNSGPVSSDTEREDL